MNKREFEVAVRAAEKILDLSFEDDNVGYSLLTVFSDYDKKKSEAYLLGNMSQELTKTTLQDMLSRNVLDKKEGDEEALTKALEDNNDGK